jgi:hypothetical protein
MKKFLFIIICSIYSIAVYSQVYTSAGTQYKIVARVTQLEAGNSFQNMEGLVTIGRDVISVNQLLSNTNYTIKLKETKMLNNGQTMTVYTCKGKSRDYYCAISSQRVNGEIVRVFIQGWNLNSPESVYILE